MNEMRQLTVIETGEQDCSDMHSYCAVRNAYILHYICNGAGVLSVRGSEYPLSAGQIFFIRPGELTGYRPDEKDPYRYKWVVFNGLLAPHLVDATAFSARPVTPPLAQAERLFDRLIEQSDLFSPCSTALLDLMSLIISNYPADIDIPAGHELAPLARDYIIANLYKSGLRVQSVADAVGVSRSFLYRIFIERYGMSPMEFIGRERINNAKKMLLEGYQVKLVASSCGYDDSLYFSSAFKKAVGVSPAKFKEQNRQPPTPGAAADKITDPIR